jgi:uncharacterized membrane protein (UPF0127 family)
VPLAAVAACVGCADGSKPLVPAAPEPVRLDVAGRSVTVELALTTPQRNQGLMNRTHLDEDAGMLFVFPDDDFRHFWMHDTVIPLDIIFLEKDGTVINVADAKPGVEKPGYSSDRKARMVLELNAGWSARHGLKPGDRVGVPSELLTKAKP